MVSEACFRSGDVICDCRQEGPLALPEPFVKRNLPG